MTQQQTTRTVQQITTETSGFAYIDADTGDHPLNTTVLAAHLASQVQTRVKNYFQTCCKLTKTFFRPVTFFSLVETTKI